MPLFQFWVRKEIYLAATKTEAHNLHKKSHIQY